MDLLTRPSIQIYDNILEISGVKLNSPEVVDYFRDMSESDKISNMIKIIEIGTSVITRISVTQNIDYIDAKIAEIFSKVKDQFFAFDNQMVAILKENLDPARAGSFMAQANSLISAQSEKVNASLDAILRATQETIVRETAKLEQGCSEFDRMFDPNNNSGYLRAIITKIDDFERGLELQFSDTDTASFVGKLRSIVNDHFGNDGQVLNLIEKKLELDNEGKTPLSQVYYNLRNEIIMLRDTIMKFVGQQELINETTKKGYPFEAIVFEKLQEIAKPFSDVVEDTSLTVVAITGSKKGDYVYTIGGTDIKIVIDAKNYGKLKSLPAMLAYLEEAKKERGAKIGIIVAPETKNLQKQIGSWNIYGTSIITSLDHLEVSIKYAKFAIQLQGSEKKGLNIPLIKDRLDSVQRKLKEITTLKSKLTKLSNGVFASVTELQNILDGIRLEIHRKLDDVEKEFRRTS